MDIVHWLIYDFPFVRLIDYLIGCLVGYIYINYSNVSKNQDKYVFYSIVISLLLANYIFIDSIISTKELVMRNLRWNIYSMIYRPSNAGLLYWLATQREILIPGC